jgi:TonB family protein
MKESTEILSPSVLAGKAISKPRPSYPRLAQILKASGDVAVDVTIDESGDVISAKATSGNLLLKDAAVKAAYNARFTPTLLSGHPVKIKGLITYKFRIVE